MTKSELIQIVVAKAKDELGVKETNDNSGTRVKQYQAATTLGGSHWPWCAALVSWCIKEAEKKTGLDIPWSFSASCDVLWADGRSRAIIRSSPQVGDVFLVKAKKGNGYSTADAIHTGFVVGVHGPKFTTVEGNTNDDGGREGVAVLGHTRDVGERYAFIRWVDDVKFPVAVAEKPWSVVVEEDGRKTPLTAILVNGTNYIGARDFATALRLSSSWDAEDGQVLIAKRPVPAQPRLFDGRAYFPVRVLAEHAGRVVEADTAKRVVLIA